MHLKNYKFKKYTISFYFIFWRYAIWNIKINTFWRTHFHEGVTENAEEEEEEEEYVKELVGDGLNAKE